MKVTSFDFWDNERKNPIVINTKDFNIKKVKKGERFTVDDVTYFINKTFKKKGYEGKCIETKMIKYKIKNTVTTHVHKCPAKKGMMQRMTPETLELMAEKFGKKNVDSWFKEGRTKMKTGLITQCPECKCVFYKEKNVLPETVEVVSLKGKKKLKKRT